MKRGFNVAALASVALFAIGPFASVAASNIDPSLLERGRYLALAGNCASCHTAKGGESLAGGLAFQTAFGTVYSTNITPDKQTGIGDWTREQFVQSLRQGVRPNGDHLYPVFPYTAFTRIRDEDANALYAYLMSVPAVNAPALENEMKFPFSQRALLSVWKALFLEEGAYQPDSTKSDEWNRGAYLVEGLGHCSACHSPRNFLGAEKSSAKMIGGEYIDAVAGGEMRTWSTPNLTPAKSGLGSWSVEELAAYLKTGRNTHTETFGPMNEVIMNSTRHLHDADVRAMATYLNSLPPRENQSGSAASEETLQAGSTLYDVHCGTCHLPTGLGAQSEDSGARLAGSPVVQASNPAALINVILYAPQLPDPPLPKRWNRMEGFGEKLTDEEVAALASYLRSAWGNTGGEVTADQVAKQR
jgi:mono/diheme cytochrome c family protein